jgi:hypothetical protein
MDVLYEDPGIVCTDRFLVIRHYYFPVGGPKRIPYAAIRSADARPLTWARGKLRLWGTANPNYWLNRDWRRPAKTTAVILDVGARVRPVITPDHPERVMSVLADHGVGR